MEEDLVEVSKFTNITEANIAKGLLESSGITAFVFYDSSGRGGSLSDHIRLMVKKSDKEEARKLLSGKTEGG